MAKKAETAKRFSEETIAEAERKRAQHRTVRRYLEALEARSRTVKRSDPEKIEQRLAEVEKELIEAQAVQRLVLTQRKLDLQMELTQATMEVDVSNFEELEAEFVEVAAEWAGRQGVTYTAMRSIGIPASVLAAAEVPRTRLPNGMA